MKFAQFFISRPIFASVLSILLMLVGSLAYVNLPIEQYPQIAPPTIQVTASYPGANADTVAKTVATPIEQEINGIEGMLYLLSQATADGRMTLTITFELGTDLDAAQVLVQNRVAIAEPRLPEEVRRLGIVTRKNSPDLMMVVNLFSPDETYDQTYIGNYAILQMRDRLRRIDGVGDIQVFGASEYAMRIWLDPDLINSFGMTAGDVVAALRSQNVQVASGTLNQTPQPKQLGIELSVQTQGRLVNPEEFENIVVKSGEGGRIVKLADVAEVELGAQNYVTRGYLGQYPAVALPVFQRPGSNAIETADAIIAEVADMAEDFPPGLAYQIAYNPTEFVEQSVDAVKLTIYEAVGLVVLVVVLFLQSWRAAIIPILAIPVSLIGTFAAMQWLGFSLNNLTLFGLVLAIGIVVDDAIVVVENMERNMAEGMGPKEAARKTMDEVGSALIAIGLVLVSVFIPTTFLGGISGQFYQQFGLTIAVATAISVLVSVSLSPALAAILMKKHAVEEQTKPSKWYQSPIKSFFRGFNTGMAKTTHGYQKVVTKLSGLLLLSMAVYLGFMALTAYQFKTTPSGFIPAQDQGYFIVSIQLPPGASLDRTDAVVQQATEKLLNIDGIENAVAFAGFAGATFTNASNAAAIFPVLESFETRGEKGLSYEGILNQMRQSMFSIPEAFVVVIPPPPVRGIGNAGGFKMMIQDRQGRGLDVLEQATWQLAMAANKHPAITSAFTFFENGTPQIFLDIDRERAERLNVPVSRVFEALEIYIGSGFVNDFNYLGRTYRVTAQAKAEARLTTDDLLRLRVRSDSGAMVPIGSLANISDIAGSSRVPRYNLYPASALIGDSSPGYSSGEALAAMEQLAAENLPDGLGYEWTELAYQEKAEGSSATIAFVLAVVFVFLLLAALYESWILPLAVILIVPMCLFSAVTGLKIAGMEINILAQIGFIVLIALACKNAILIVEFAHDLEKKGRSVSEAAREAAKLRLRPILMTSLAFILGVLPLVLADGAGAEMRQALGVTVFSGMIGVTFFGLIFTPLFYIMCRKMGDYFSGKSTTKA